jgi:hypothetical protein
VSLFGAYVCPRGVHFVEARPREGGLQVLRTFESVRVLRSAAEAAREVAAALAEAGARRAEVALVVRGFDLGHHTLTLPPARDEMLAPIIEREVRRLEPNLTDPVIGWMPLPDEDPGGDHPPQRQLCVAALPGAAAALFESELREAGHTLWHLTALPAAVQRLAHELDGDQAVTAMLAPLPDGLFLGLLLGGVLRIPIEPPLLEHDVPDGTAMAEETELGATYVRQQFRGARVERAVIVGPAELWPDTQSLLIERLGVPVQRIDLQGLSTASLAALGAIMDARAPEPLAIAGRTVAQKHRASRAVLRQVSLAAVAATVIVAAWAVLQAVDARRANDQLLDARRRLSQATVDVGPLRQTAEQRRLVRDAMTLLRVTNRDRAELQHALAAIGSGVTGPIRLDSLQFDRGSDGWVASLAGRAAGTTSGGAVQALHDFYRDLPRRVVMDALALEELAYVDSAASAGSFVRFRVSFVLPSRSD